MNRERELIDEFLVRSSQAGFRFSRNNSGVAFHKDGSTVAYGLFRPGGSDLIGWVPRLITPTMVGKRIAQFAAVELKTGRQKPRPEQQRFLDLVQKAGGIAAWGSDVDAIMGALVWPD